MYVFFAGSMAFHSPSIARLTCVPFIHARIFEPRQKKKMSAFPEGTDAGGEIEGAVPRSTLEALANPAPLTHSFVSAAGSAARQTDVKPSRNNKTGMTPRRFSRTSRGKHEDLTGRYGPTLASLPPDESRNYALPPRNGG